MIFYTIFSICIQTVQYLWRGLTARKLRQGMCRQKKTLLLKIFLVSVQTKKWFFTLFLVSAYKLSNTSGAA